MGIYPKPGKTVPYVFSPQLREPVEIQAGIYREKKEAALNEGTDPTTFSGTILKHDPNEYPNLEFFVTSPQGFSYGLFRDTQDTKRLYWKDENNRLISGYFPFYAVDEVMATDDGLYVLFEEGARTLFYEFYKPVWHIDRLEKARRFLAPFVKKDLAGRGKEITVSYDSIVPGTSVVAKQKVLIAEENVFVLTDPIDNLLEPKAFSQTSYVGLPQGYYPVHFMPLWMPALSTEIKEKYIRIHTFQGAKQAQGVCILLDGDLARPCDLIIKYDAHFEDVSIAARFGLEEAAMADALQPFRAREPFADHLFQAFDLPQGSVTREALEKMQERVLGTAQPFDFEQLLEKMPEELQLVIFPVPEVGSEKALKLKWLAGHLEKLDAAWKSSFIWTDQGNVLGFLSFEAKRAGWTITDFILENDIGQAEWDSLKSELEKLEKTLYKSSAHGIFIVSERLLPYLYFAIEEMKKPYSKYAWIRDHKIFSKSPDMVGTLVVVNPATSHTTHNLPAAAVQALGLADERGWMFELPEGEMLYDNEVVAAHLQPRIKAERNTFVVILGGN